MASEKKNSETYKDNNHKKNEKPIIRRKLPMKLALIYHIANVTRYNMFVSLLLLGSSPILSIENHQFYCITHAIYVE